MWISIPVRRSGLKPFAEASMSYTAAGRPTKEKKPSWFVSVSRLIPEPASVRTMCALATRAPVLSVTVPVSIAVPF